MRYPSRRWRALASAGLLLLAIGGAPALAAAPSTHAIVAKPTNSAQLHRAVAALAKRAAAARAAADKAETAAASAAQTLRFALANLAAVKASAGNAVAQLAIPQQQNNYAVTAAEAQLQAAQQRAQQADLAASMASIQPPAAGPGSAIINSVTQNESTTAQFAVMQAQQNLAAAQLSAGSPALGAVNTPSPGAASVNQAEIAVHSAQALAKSTAAAARAAERNAETLAEEADRAGAAAGG